MPFPPFNTKIAPKDTGKRHGDGSCVSFEDTGTVLVSHSSCPENYSFDKSSRHQDGSTSLRQSLRVRIPGITIFILYGAAFGGV
jgi:hypothetical protein